MNPADPPGAGPDGPRDDDSLPEGIEPTGVPRRGSAGDALVITVGVIVALLVLIVTLGWIVFHRLT